jgi:hypothetical protein
MKFFLAAFMTCSASSIAVGADLLDSLGLGKKALTNQSALTANLSQEQMIGGLKEALGKGVEQAITRLGHEGGFLTNLTVKIPLPEKFRAVEKTLRAVKQEKLADDFVTTMNRAAEQAVPEAGSVFRDAISVMTVADAKSILTGRTNAATQYFRKATETNLFNKFLPIVKKATDEAGVTSAYKRFVEKGSSAGSLGSFGNSLFKTESLDIDSYVTTKALDGLFKMVAEEEKRIRENPAARTSELLQKVFGAIK